MRFEFFMAMLPPTITQQEKSITIRNGKPVVYEPAELKQAREKLRAHLAKHVPKKRFTGPVWLGVKWCFPIRGRHRDGEYKATKPDTDNGEDAERRDGGLGFFKNDAQVASEHVEKFGQRSRGSIL